MTRLEDIGIVVQNDSDGGLGRGTVAILYEVAGMLETLIDTGKGNAIDRRSLPLAPGEYDQLRETLGTGEVHADVEALGPTRIQETGIHGVWWITHYNAHDQVIAEFIEVTAIPQMLKAHADDMREGLDALNEQLARK